ncbi:MAG TPA: glycerate kinase [Salinisphaeraceae bacterium]|nr:glycerate kinase [Salinisphaeraceae bacterium]
MDKTTRRMDNPGSWLRRLFNHAVQAVQPRQCLPSHLPARPVGRTLVVGAGKAAAAMAQAVEAHWPGQLAGLVVTRYGHGAPCRQIEVLEAAHPVPDGLSEQAARRMLAAVASLGEDDLLLALISGGGSSLLCLPAPGITLADKQAVARALLRSGAPIAAINTVRSQLSAIKGGRLAAAAAPARVVSLVISDIPDNNPALVASGPTIASRSTRAEALAIVERYAIELPERVRLLLEQPTAAREPLPQAARQSVTVIATAADALAAAQHYAAQDGLRVQLLGDALEGEARALGRAHARQALQLQAASRRPQLLLSGGETSVTLRASGRGGRNTEYLLGLAQALAGAPGIFALAADTDGIDGSEDNAGALLYPDTLARARAAGVDAAACLANNNAYDLFAATGDLLMTGPTRTNVNDFRAILINP